VMRPPLVRFASLLAALMFQFAGSAKSDERADALFDVSQTALGQSLPDITFVDTEGKKVSLRDFRGRPLLVSLIYAGCADVCPTLIENLVPAVEAAQSALGRDSFSVITIGFDTRQDTPQRLKSFAVARGADLPGWTFLSAEVDSLDGLARAVGFGFYSRAGGFDHLSQVSIVDGDGKLYQQVYGAVFEPPLIVEPLKTLVFKRDRPLLSMTQLINRVKFFCTVYDPSSGRYYFNYSLFMGIAIGFACFGFVLFALIREWRKGVVGSTEIS
jgi:protein SCO1/2